MRAGRRYKWGDINIDGTSHLSSVFSAYSVHSARPAAIKRNSRSALRLVLAFFKGLITLFVWPCSQLVRGVQLLVARIAGRERLESNHRAAVRELSKPVTLKQAEYMRMRLSLGISAADEAKPPILGENYQREGIIALLCAAMCLIAFIITPGISIGKGQKAFTLNDDGRSVKVVTSANTVQEFVDTGGLKLLGGDSMDKGPNELIAAGMVLSIDRGIPITVHTGGKTLETSVDGGTVADALRELGIEPGELDVVSPAPETLVSEQMVITHDVVRVDYVEQSQRVAFKTIKKNADELNKGVEKVEASGRDGELSKKLKVVYKNGEEASRSVVNTTVVRAPQDRVVLVGTGAGAAASDTKQVASNKADAEPETRAEPAKTAAPQKPAATRKKPADIDAADDDTIAAPGGKNAPRADQIARVVNMEATAYTHTGERTATGKWPKVGMVAINPKQIAYGTRLYVPGYGYCVAEDTGAFRHNGKSRIDLFMNTVSDCMKWGRRQIKVYILK